MEGWGEEGGGGGEVRTPRAPRGPSLGRGKGGGVVNQEPPCAPWGPCSWACGTHASDTISCCCMMD